MASDFPLQRRIRPALPNRIVRLLFCAVCVRRCNELFTYLSGTAHMSKYCETTMILQMKRLSAVFLLVLLGMVTLSANSGGFIMRAKYPHANGLSIVDAVTTAVWETATGKSYMELGDLTHHVGELIPERQCIAADLKGAIRVSCEVARPTFKECPKKDNCVVLQIDQSILQDQTLRKAIKRAIACPCHALTNPRQSHHVPDQFLGLRYVVSNAWSFLECDSRKPVTATIHDRSANTLTVEF